MEQAALSSVRETRSRRIRIAAVTSYFPASEGSYQGHSVFHTFQHLKQYADLEVICPSAAYLRIPATRFRTPRPREITYQPPGFRASYFGYPAIPYFTRPLNGLICQRYLEGYLRRAKPDLILNYWLYPEGFAAVRAARALGVPVVVGSIGSDLRRIPDRITRSLVSRTVRAADGVITVSEDLRRLAIALGAPPHKVTTILNGCDRDVFYPGERGDARRAVGSDVREQVVLYVGSLFRAKGVGELLEAFSGLTAARPHARLVCIGDGPCRADMLRGAASAGVADRVKLLGRQPSEVVAAWMRAADVFCLPSYSEGCPNVVVEALACGRPVVATEVGGIPELVKPGCGLLVPPRDPGALRAALDSALSQNWDTQNIASTSRRGWKEVAEETFAVCESVLESTARP
jgi:teichuronic acid biosynthesis glycosyltransferase TuaC